MIILPFISSAMNYSIGDTLNVVAINGLTVRSIPSVKGEKITLLKTQERVCIKDTSNFKIQNDSIFGFSGNWILIQTTENILGYVFDAFLSTLPVAKSISEHGSSVGYTQRLPYLLKQFAFDNFIKTDCIYEYDNRTDGESSHRMNILNFQEGHELIEHQYWEGSSNELRLKNVRISEVYYLVNQFLKYTSEEILKLSDNNLRNPKSYRQGRGCVGELIDNGCVIEVFEDSEGAYTIQFNFPCC